MNDARTPSQRRPVAPAVLGRGLIATELLVVFTPLYLALLLNERVGGDHTDLVGGTALIIGPLPIAGGVVTFALFWLAMRRRGETWGDVGLARPAGWPRTVAMALVISLSVFVAVAFVVNPIIADLDLAPRDMSRFERLQDSLPTLIINIGFMWLTAAFLEELLWRGYLINRLLDLFGRNSRVTQGWVLLASSVLFALPHFTQGPEGMIKTGAIGFVFGGAYLSIGRRLWPLVLSHGLIDTLDFVSHYLDT